MFGNYGEVSEAAHITQGQRGGEKALAVSYIRMSVAVAAVKGQSHTLLGRLEVLGPGTAAAAERRREAQVHE